MGGWKKVLLIGAALGAAYYFLKKNSISQTVEDGEGEILDENGNPITKTYVTLDKEALKEKAGDVIDKVAPIIDDTREKITPIINAAKEKVNSILVRPEDEAADDGNAASPTDDGENTADGASAAENAAPEEEEFYNDGDKAQA